MNSELKVRLAAAILCHTPPTVGMLRDALQAIDELDRVVEAAECIRHWHDVELTSGDGMVVSADAVRNLWKALEQAKGTP